MVYQSDSTQKFKPLKLSLLSAHVNNAALTRKKPWQFNILDNKVYLENVFPMDVFQPVYTVVFRCGEDEWIVEFGQIPSLRMHPFFIDKPEVLYIPEDVKLTVLEILLIPLLEQFEVFIGASVELVETTFSYEQEVSVSCSIPLLLYIESDGMSIPIRLGIRKRNDALMLLKKFQALPSNYRDISKLPVAIGIEAGYTKLNMDQLCVLQIDDILIPDKYFIQEEKIQLRFSNFLVDCKFHGGIVTVMDVNNTETSSPTANNANIDQKTTSDQIQPQEQTADNVQKNSRQAVAQPNVKKTGNASANIDVTGLELPVVFELEQRFMTVHDIGSLAPGYTFALSVDLQSPVTLRVNGKAIGLGRLVELNGTLGVQVIQLME